MSTNRLPPRSPANPYPHKISSLVFIRNLQDELLLIKREKAPNRGCWSPIGGKLDTNSGESPFECAARETAEETGFTVQTSDLHLFGYVAEKAYEGQSHWLMFLFRVIPPIDFTPVRMQEGTFSFFSRSAINQIPIPPTDHQLVWPLWDEHRFGFIALRADFRAGGAVCPITEMILPGPLETR